MEYIFGTIKRKGKIVDILKTVGDTHTDLKDNHSIVREYPDSKITDTFVIANHYQSKEDSEGKCYDWYEITDHYRYIDYFMPQKQSLIDELTPYTETKTGYYGESEKTFYGVPDGHVTVLFGNYNPNYSVNRVSDRVTVSFDTLTEQTDITINVK